MGKIDTEAKAYLSNDERFSDLFNFWIYNGKNVIQPDELQELGIHDLLAVSDSNILQFVPDYKLNLLSPNVLSDEDFNKFHTSLGAALQFLKHQHDDNMDWLQGKEPLVDKATAEFIRTTTGTNFEFDKTEEVINMCRAWHKTMKEKFLKDRKRIR